MKQMGETTATTDHPHLDATAMSTMVVLCALWGIQQVAIKVANAGISPVLQAGLRSAGAAMLIWIWAAIRGVRLVDRSTPIGLAFLIGVMFGSEFLLIYWGLTFTTASRSVVLLYTAPFFVAIGAHLFIPGERLRPLQWLGLAAAFGGIVVTFGDALRLPTRHELIGDVMVFAAAAVWAATTVIIKATRLRMLEPSKTLFYQLAVSGVVLPVAAVVLGTATVGIQAWDRSQWVAERYPEEAVQNVRGGESAERAGMRWSVQVSRAPVDSKPGRVMLQITVLLTPLEEKAIQDFVEPKIELRDTAGRTWMALSNPGDTPLRSDLRVGRTNRFVAYGVVPEELEKTAKVALVYAGADGSDVLLFNR